MLLTRRLSITIHEDAYGPLQQLADKETDSNINRMIRHIIYQELVRSGHMSVEMLASLWAE